MAGEDVISGDDQGGVDEMVLTIDCQGDFRRVSASTVIRLFNLTDEILVQIGKVVGDRLSAFVRLPNLKVNNGARATSMTTSRAVLQYKLSLHLQDAQRDLCKQVLASIFVKKVSRTCRDGTISEATRSNLK